MMYKKGTKVEVLDRKGVPSGTWRPAEIVSGNGHTYHVKYDPPLQGDDELAERVARKCIRPRPPPAQGQIDWLPGDIVEAFDSTSWKLAEVVSAVTLSSFSVRLLGSSRALTVQRSDLRRRQCWENDRWVAIGKDARSSGEEKSQRFEPSRGKKRGSEESSLLERGDASACSSSGSNDLGLTLRHRCSSDRDDLSDDGSSSCRSVLRAKMSTSTGREAAERIHKLELYAYRATMEALYSSGSITWEQQELMTNLRLELHISNDEHLSELRYLSSQSS